MAAEKIVKDTSAVLKNGLGAVKSNTYGIGGAVLDLGLNAFFNVQQGNNIGTAILKGIPESVAWAVAPGLMTANMIGQMVPAAVQGYMTASSALRGKYAKNHIGGTSFSYQDTRAALTMRQASVQAIQGSKMNARNALGGEASLMHRNWSDRM